jgi:hypothetical protein
MGTGSRILSPPGVLVFTVAAAPERPDVTRSSQRRDGRGSRRRPVVESAHAAAEPAFEAWLGKENPIGARIVAEKMFTFSMEG